MIQEMSLDLFGERFAVFAPPPDARRQLVKKAETLAESAERAELAALELKRGEKTMKGGLNDETG